MNSATEYVYLHIVNYKPTYRDLVMAASLWAEDQTGGIADYRDIVAESVESNWDEMGLRPEDWDREDVDYAEIVNREAGDL